MNIATKINDLDSTEKLIYTYHLHIQVLPTYIETFVRSPYILTLERF